MQCRACGQDVPLGAALCQHCGAAQPKTDRPVVSNVQVETAAQPTHATSPQSASPAAAIAPFPTPGRPPVGNPPVSPWRAAPTYSYPQRVDARSQGLILGVLGLLALGAIFAYALPSITAPDFDDEISFRTTRLFYPHAWLWWLAHLGIVIAGIAAVAFTVSNRLAQAWWITIGCALTLPWLINLVSYFDEFGVTVRLGSGMWLSTLCFIGAALIPWIALKNAE